MACDMQTSSTMKQPVQNDSMVESEFSTLKPVNGSRQMLRVYKSEFESRKAAAQEVLAKLKAHLGAGGYAVTDDEALADVGIALGLVVKVAGRYGGIVTPQPVINNARRLMQAVSAMTAEQRIAFMDLLTAGNNVLR